jgi:hypothetical protein
LDENYNTLNSQPTHSFDLFYVKNGQREILPSLGICRPLTFHILIFFSENPHPNELKLGYQVSVHLVKRFQRRFKKICQSETRIACGGHVC